MESIITQKEEMDNTNYEEEEVDNENLKTDQLGDEEQLNSEKNQVSQNGLMREEKERLQARIVELEALYEKTRLELEATREVR